MEKSLSTEGESFITDLLSFGYSGGDFPTYNISLRGN